MNVWRWIALALLASTASCRAAGADALVTNPCSTPAEVVILEGRGEGQDAHHVVVVPANTDDHPLTGLNFPRSPFSGGVILIRTGLKGYYKDVVQPSDGPAHYSIPVRWCPALFQGRG